ncbi:MAG: hypothetical protein HXX08_25025 [Chloroflexi bacterium]|uniref:site-specific DNA-methyltransferase (adenine-specific) n=1 Tax=Candidatus Chlorohelix allophototropha TaxID=3003348 RepID=A0A8T7MAQ0_9CHLR|nr:hypothetical protein [Chloroflexota bacterium]WJW70443.1 hypothetical protein OZ401_005079 [Chloroflexota bacterium L227-S17]
MIIGNPPYLEMREIDYQPRNFKSVESGAVHVLCIERGLNLLKATGGLSMIVPLALVSTQRMQTIQNLLENKRTVFYSNYSWRPGKLFDTVNRALTIFIAHFTKESKTFSTKYEKWISETRNGLIERISYVEVPHQRQLFWVPKLGSNIEQSILNKVTKQKSTIAHFNTKSDYKVFYRTTGGLYWKVFTDFPPAFNVEGKSGHSSRETWFSLSKKEMVKPVIAILSSDIFWWWYTITTNLRDLNPSDIQKFPIPEDVLNDTTLARVAETYLKDLQQNSTMLMRIQKQTGLTETQSFKIQKSKPIINEIDRILAQHYGFTAEELDFIINYDIKYRMGKSSEEEGEE